MTASCGPPRSALRRVEALKAVVAASCVAAVLLAWTAARGALGASRNDDWGFYRVAFRFAADGKFVPDGWGGMFFLGQALISTPIVKLFGPDPLPLQVLVATLGAVGIWASYVLLRGFLSKVHSLIAVGCLVFGPVFGSLAVSYMTDVPAMALSMVALVIASSGVNRRHPVVWLVLALATTSVAFTIREHAVAAGLAAVIVHLVHARSRRAIMAAAAIWLLALVGLFAWRSGLEHSVSFQLDTSPDSIVAGLKTVCAGIVTLAFFVSPALLRVSFRRLRLTTGRSLYPAIVVGLATFSVAYRSSGVFVGNYFSSVGPGASFWSGSPAPVVPGWLLLAAKAVALLATLVLAAIATRATGDLWVWVRDMPTKAVARSGVHGLRHQPSSLVASFAYLATFGALQVVIILLLDAPFFDRYLLSLIPIAAGLVFWAIKVRHLQPNPERSVVLRWIVPASTAVVLVLAGVAQLDGNATRDGLAWEMSERLVEQGVPAGRIDGGPWEGLHQADWWTRASRPSTACAEVRHVGPTAGNDALMVERRRTVFGALVGFEAVKLHVDDADCLPAENR